MVMGEDILRDSALSDPCCRVALLHYFIPMGANESGTNDADPNGTPNNLFQFISHVAGGKLPQLSEFWGDCPSKDGTGVGYYSILLI